MNLIDYRHSFDAENSSGEMYAYVDQRKIGLLEYNIRHVNAISTLFISNIVNYTSPRAKKVYDGGVEVAGVGTKLFKKAVAFAVKNEHGLSFDVAKGSEGFYKKILAALFVEEKPGSFANMVEKRHHVHFSADFVQNRLVEKIA